MRAIAALPRGGGQLIQEVGLDNFSVGRPGAVGKSKIGMYFSLEGRSGVETW